MVIIKKKKKCGTWEGEKVKKKLKIQKLMWKTRR